MRGEVVHVGVASGTGSSKAAPPSFHSPGCGCGRGGGQSHCPSHLIGGAEGRLAELADLPDVLPRHHPSPPETPTYHALDVGVEAQWRRALRFAAGRKDTEKSGFLGETDYWLLIHYIQYIFLVQAAWHALDARCKTTWSIFQHNVETSGGTSFLNPSLHLKGEIPWS